MQAYNSCKLRAQSVGAGAISPETLYSLSAPPKQAMHMRCSSNNACTSGSNTTQNFVELRRSLGYNSSDKMLVCQPLMPNKLPHPRRQLAVEPYVACVGKGRVYCMDICMRAQEPIAREAPTTIQSQSARKSKPSSLCNELQPLSPIHTPPPTAHPHHHQEHPLPPRTRHHKSILPQHRRRHNPPD